MEWCEDCEHSNAGECNQHGPLLVVQDNVVQSRARQSLPHMLCIGPPTGEGGAVSSRYMGDAEGPSVFARELVRRRTRFGPLQAKELDSHPSGNAFGSSLEFGLFLEGQEPIFIGRTENWEEYCNWMAMVRPARNAEEQNLVAFQYHAGIYFVTIKDIEPNTELRVWYAREYAYCMGTKPLKSIDYVEEKERKDNGRKKDVQLGRARASSSTQAAYSGRPHSGDSSKSSSPSKSYGSRGRSLRSEGRLQRLGEAMREWRDSTAPRTRRGNSGRSEAPALRESPRRTAEALSGKSKKVIKNEENKNTKEMAGDWSLCGRLRSGTKDAGQSSEPKSSPDSTPQTADSKWRPDALVDTADESGRETELPTTPIPSTSETTPKRHRCSVCGKTFGSPGKLAQHSYSHTGERPFVCSDCPKAFSSKFKLERHKLIHTGERRHQCATCSRSFRRRDHLRNHERVHRSAAGDSVTPDVSAPAVTVAASPILRCDRPQCSREFRSAAAHGRHMASHAAREGVLQCEVCGARGFARASEVLRHLREAHVPQTRPSTSVAARGATESEVPRRFPCSDCGRTFFTRKDVRRHLVVHTGRRDFLCQFCPQRFGRKDHLIRHTKKGHGMDIESVGTSGGGETSGGSAPGMSESTMSTMPIIVSTTSLKSEQCSSNSPLPMSSVEFANPSELPTLRMEGIGEGPRMYDEENRVDLEHLLSLIPPLPSSPSGSESAAHSQGHSPFSLRPPDRDPLAPDPLSLLSENVSGVAEQVIPQPESTPLPRFDQVFHPQQP
ncbi:PR domain zinc finger protein 10-like isoform X2 [Ischnura elegans]|uniref:PR domain zinc finger protein 10-like isoform X2 n=1 Tax=Ischnura elegans TaxID=197161 RepID=UPI001ED8663F|nr:PR domain zinc finger protein 10-like isoform X2 [Ischnura elegans]